MSPKSQRLKTTAFLLVAVGLILACGVSEATPNPPPGVDATKAALQLRSTAMSLQLTQSALNSQPQVQPTHPPPPTPTENAAAPTETAPALTEGAPEAPTQALASPTEDVEERIKAAKVLLYEDTDELGIGQWIEEALDGMGLQYTQTGSYSGRFMEHLNSGAKYDLIIVGSEKRGAITGEFWDVINTRLTRDKSALIAELWNLNQEANGPISKILGPCGVSYRGQFAPAESIYWWTPDHLVFNEPNVALPLIHFVPYWDDAGDKLRIGGSGDATLLAGLSAKPSSGEAVLATCYGGRVIIQTFCNHDYRESEIIPLWQNYIQYTLKNHFAVTP